MAFIAIVGLANEPSTPEKPLLEFSYQLFIAVERLPLSGLLGRSVSGASEPYVIFRPISDKVPSDLSR
ncbi:hypothetical protein [Streptomyces sp. NBC_00306]|uniref:hypothetical protein n=1 Tax=Streptomyces sp. NBC_00306 TaxID=2975708 RepID=UPI002E299E29|nr:hypothetical protein [Streptomyces sp. NBC_00306]